MIRETARSELRARDGEVATSTKYHLELDIYVVKRKASGANSVTALDRALEPAPHSHRRLSFWTSLIYIANTAIFENRSTSTDPRLSASADSLGIL